MMRALKKATAARSRQSASDLASNWACRDHEQEANIVCAQLTHWPPNDSTTPAPLSLYRDAILSRGREHFSPAHAAPKITELPCRRASIRSWTCQSAGWTEKKKKGKKSRQRRREERASRRNHERRWWSRSSNSETEDEAKLTETSVRSGTHTRQTDPCLEQLCGARGGGLAGLGA